MLLYSDDITTRDAVRVNVGRRPARDVEVARWRECATAAAVIEAVEAGGFDLLDPRRRGRAHGRSWPVPPAQERDLQLPADPGAHRPPQDGWLATWSLADLVVPHPLDPIALPAAVAELRRPRRTPRRLTGDGATAAPTTWPDLLTSLLAGHDLSREAAAWAMEQIMSGEASPVQLAGFLVALRAKGETRRRARGASPT